MQPPTRKTCSEKQLPLELKFGACRGRRGGFPGLRFSRGFVQFAMVGFPKLVVS